MLIVSVRIQPDIDKKLAHDAKKERLSVSDIVRRILLKHYGLLDGRRA